MYYLGDGITKDTEEGIRWSKKAALQGNVYAAHNLGIIFKKGFGVPANLEESLKWFRIGAENGYTVSQSILGSIYLSEDSLKDYEEAYRWFKMGADQGDAHSQYSLGWLYTNNEDISDDVKAVKWYRKAAKQGDVASQVIIGGAYRKGQGVEKNDRKAAIWYRMAAANRSGDAALYLSAMFSDGEGVIKDIVLAHAWATIAVINGSPKAAKMEDLLRDQMSEQEVWDSQMLLPILNCVDEEELPLIKDSSKFAQTDRIVEASLSGNTLNIRIDEKTHFEWMQEDAFKNDPFAQLKLGECYEEGIGVEDSLTDAMKWYMVSYLNGFEGSLARIRSAMDGFEDDLQVLFSYHLSKEWMREYFPGEGKEYLFLIIWLFKSKASGHDKDKT